jgi:hypothetical protein
VPSRPSKPTQRFPDALVPWCFSPSPPLPSPPHPCAQVQIHLARAQIPCSLKQIGGQLARSLIPPSDDDKPLATAPNSSLLRLHLPLPSEPPTHLATRFPGVTNTRPHERPLLTSPHLRPHPHLNPRRAPPRRADFPLWSRLEPRIPAHHRTPVPHRRNPRRVSSCSSQATHGQDPQDDEAGGK